MRINHLATLLISTSMISPCFSDDLFSDETAVNTQQLSEQRGMSDTFVNLQINDSDQNALLQDNQINGSYTGNNNISDGALTGFKGISTVIQNTGNQVIIQGNTMINVLIQQ